MGSRSSDCVPLIPDPTPESITYLHTKVTKMGHLLEVDQLAEMGHLMAVG